MILGFKKYYPWKEPTWFREKIWAALGYKDIGATDSHTGQIIPYLYIPSILNHEGIKSYVPKIHTIRKDPHNRWKAGMRIQMVYRGPKYSIEDHFNKGIEGLEECKCVQTIRMKWGTRMEKITIHIDSKLFAVIPAMTNVEVKEPFLSNGLLLARNDGFDNVIDFAKWFKWNDFTGKILHWTDFKYQEIE